MMSQLVGLNTGVCIAPRMALKRNPPVGLTLRGLFDKSANS